MDYEYDIYTQDWYSQTWDCTCDVGSFDTCPVCERSSRIANERFLKANKYEPDKFQGEVEPYWWKNAQGNLVDMHKMDLDYKINCLKLSIRKGDPVKEQEFRDVIAVMHPAIDVSTLSAENVDDWD